MIGAICGDIIGSVHEGAATKTKHFPLFVPQCRFTDDTVLTVAVAARLLHGGDYVDQFHAYFHACPHAGYGGTFIEWARQRRRQPYGSWGNGAAMRASPVGIACESLDDVLAEARRSAEVTHDHPEGIRGAQATATAVFLARTDASKPDIRACLERTFGYDLSQRAGRHPRWVSVRYLLPGFGAAVGRGLPGIRQLRRRDPQCDFAGRRR